MRSIKSACCISRRGSGSVSITSVKISLEYGHISGGRTTFLRTFGSSLGRSEMMAQTSEVLPTLSK